MLCKYSVRLKDEEIGCDEWVELRNFKLFFGCVKREVKNVVIWLENGDGWIYYYGRYKWRWEKFKSGNWKGQLKLF